MKNFSFEPGTRIRRDGVAYIVDHSGQRGVALRPLDPDAVQVVPAADLAEEHRNGALVVEDLYAEESAAAAAAKAPILKALSEYPEHVGKVAARRKKFLVAVCPTGRLRCPKRLLAKLLREVWLNLPADERGVAPPSLSRFYQWRKDWIKSSFSDHALIPRLDKRGRTPVPLPAELKGLLMRVTEEEYATQERPTVAETLRSAIAKVDRQNRTRSDGNQIPKPTLVQIRRVIESYDPERLLQRRYGKAIARARTRISQAGPGAARLLERVEVDHTRADVICVTSKTHVPLGRPWLTLLIDVASRMIIGVWISFETPNANTVLRVLKQVIRRKEALLAKYKLKGRWPAYGVPLVLVMDNGKEFHSKALDAAAQDLGMTLVYCPSREPRFKGVIERFNRTLNTGLVHMMPGTTFSDPKDRGDYDSQACAVLTIDEFRQLVFKWIVEVYSLTLHRTLNAAPLQRWDELEAICPPQMPLHVEALDTYLRPLETRALSNKGIEINSLFYVSRELRDLRLRNGLRDRNVRLDVRADPDNVGAIQVLHPEEGTYFTATCTLPEYAEGMTLEQHKFHKKNAARKYAQLDFESALLASKQEIRDTVEKVIKQGRRRAALEAAAGQTEDTGGRGPKKVASVASDAIAARPRRARREALNSDAKAKMRAVEHAADDTLLEEVEAAADAAGPVTTGEDFASFDDVEAFGPREPELF